MFYGSKRVPMSLIALSFLLLLVLAACGGEVNVNANTTPTVAATTPAASNKGEITSACNVLTEESVKQIVPGSYTKTDQTTTVQDLKQQTCGYTDIAGGLTISFAISTGQTVATTYMGTQMLAQSDPENYKTVTGLGDDAVFETMSTLHTLVVKKGDALLQVTIMNLTKEDDTRSGDLELYKQLAQAALKNI